jgi:hypothetical protein
VLIPGRTQEQRDLVLIRSLVTNLDDECPRWAEECVENPIPATDFPEGELDFRLRGHGVETIRAGLTVVLAMFAPHAEEVFPLYTEEISSREKVGLVRILVADGLDRGVAERYVQAFAAAPLDVWMSIAHWVTARDRAAQSGGS